MNATDLVREIERIGPLVVAPTQVAEAERSTAWTRLDRALTKVNELAKFLDADTITTLSDDLRARYDQPPPSERDSINRVADPHAPLEEVVALVDLTARNRLSLGGT
jgi:hypothetical protein